MPVLKTKLSICLCAAEVEVYYTMHIRHDNVLMLDMFKSVSNIYTIDCFTCASKLNIKDKYAKISKIFSL